MRVVSLYPGPKLSFSSSGQGRAYTTTGTSGTRLEAVSNYGVHCNELTLNVFRAQDGSGSLVGLGCARGIEGVGVESGTFRIMSEADKAAVDGALRIGVVGVGVMGSNHARVLSELPGLKLIGVVDPDRKTREHVA